MKKALVAAAAIVLAPLGAQAQTLQYPGFYIGAIGGVNWLLNTTFNTNFAAPAFGVAGSVSTNAQFQTGWGAGGMVGYDFVGPRVEIEAMYRDNQATVNLQSGSTFSPNFGADLNQTAVMANFFYDFLAGQTIVPYIGAGVGVAFINTSALGTASSSTQFAYQGMIGVGWNINEQFRVNLEGRYYGTTQPWFSWSGSNIFVNGSIPNNNLGIFASLQYKFGAPVVAPPPPPPPVAPPSFMVFFDWDRSNLSAQALNTIKQAADAFRAKGNARITATGHTDTVGSDAYNMRLSRRRAESVASRLEKDGIAASEIEIVAKGKRDPLVPTADGVREPQNRRVQIVLD